VFEGARWTFGELADRVDDAARALLAAGVAPGDRVATLSPPHPDFYVTFLATASIGAIWLGLNPRYQLPELEYVVRDAEPSLILARGAIRDRDFRKELAALQASCPSVQRFVILDPAPVEREVGYSAFIDAGRAVDDATLAAAREAVEPRAVCVIVYTSGTTGRPKGAMIRHDGLVHVARVQRAIWPVEPLRIINNLPINHIGCIGDIGADTLVAGGTLIFQEDFDPGAMLKAVRTEGVTLFGHIPTALQMVVAHPDWKETDFSKVQLIIWEGAAAPVDLIEALRAKVPALANAYGMTETVGSVTFTFDQTDTDVLANSVGWPVPEYEVRIADERGLATRPGETGEVQVRGGFVTAGYWRRPEATAELFTADGWLRTGDLAEQRPDGAFRLVGRLKEMFKSGGYNVYPREIEQAIESHPDVAEAAVVGMPDPLFSEVGHAFVLLHPGRGTDAETLLAHCRTRLANYKVPKRLTLVSEFPMLPIGKVDKQALKAMAKPSLPQ